MQQTIELPRLSPIPSPTLTTLVSSSPADPNWDSFLCAQPHGHHTQSGAWAQLKTRHGWDVIRLIVQREGRIVAGAQLLTRHMAGLPVRVGYVANGPIVSAQASDILPFVLQSTERLAARHGAWIIRIQLPPGGEEGLPWLKAHAYVKSRVSVSPVSTLVIDLRPSESELLAGMTASARRNMRHAARRGVTVRAGEASDLPAFHRLLAETGERHGFTPYALDYLHTLWQVFSPGGLCKLLLAEYEGCVLGANLLLAFGDRVYYKFGASSGLHRALKANDLLQWECIRWAKQNGYRHYDLEGIDRDVARRVLSGSPLPPEDTPKLGPTFFKLHFGGTPVLMPEAYQKGLGPLAPVVSTRAFSALTDWTPLVRWVRLGRK